jgi:hypothetical protein
MPEYWLLPRQWEGATAAVLCSGQSLTAEDAEKVRHLPRITTNATYRMARDADILYGSDVFFWRHVEYRDAFDCPGVKLCVEQTPGMAPFAPAGVRIVKHGGTSGFTDEPGKIRTGGHSGYAAIHVAASMGAKRIIVLGLDMCGDHWHGRHPHGLNNPKEDRFRAWIRNFRTLGQELNSRGIEVFNCSPISKLDTFQKATLASLL